jgi:hypothetical protein
MQHLTEARMLHPNVGAAEDGLQINLGKWGFIFASADKTQAQ